MAKIWSEENKFQKWVEIEILACEAQSKLGMVPQEAVETIRKRAKFDLSRIIELEKETKHEVLAFLANVSENVGVEARFLHQGMTSSDIMDTALSLLMKEAGELIYQDLQELAKTLKEKALEYKDTIMIGRTHGMYAEPITFGLKLAVFYEETKRNLRRMERALENIAYGKISGVVGTYAHNPPFVEEYVCEKLGLKPASISTQILQRDRHAEYLTVLAIIASSLEKFATEIRHLQRSEVGEAGEPFTKGQKGSSAMPHKRNPITCERISGLARVVRVNALAALEDVTLWHERDISHSSVERIIIPDSTSLLDYLLTLTNEIFQNLQVFPERMLKNLEGAKESFHSQRILLELIRKGVKREEAYLWVQQAAMEAFSEGKDFREKILKDERVNQFLNEKELNSCFELSYYLKYVDKIYERLGIL